MLDNPMIKERRDPYTHYRNPVQTGPRCGCGRIAKYRVYSHQELHCENCFREAINGDFVVPVSVL